MHAWKHAWSRAALQAAPLPHLELRLLRRRALLEEGVVVQALVLFAEALAAILAICGLCAVMRPQRHLCACTGSRLEAVMLSILQGTPRPSHRH